MEVRFALMVAAVLASLGDISTLAQESSLRSAAEGRRWLADERQQPRHSERVTHRGFEVSTGQIVVVATTSLADARLAAQQATLGWESTAQLADHLTSVHHQPNFAQGAVQVVIDGEPVQQRDEPLSMVNVVGPATQITINVAPGQPSLEEQQGRLRQAAALAFLHTAELDRQLPEWVCQGLAAYAGKLPTDSKGSAAAMEDAQAAPFGGSQGRKQRTAPDRLEEHPAERPDAAQLVQFLIEGNDARHAAPFFELLREHLETRATDYDRGYQRRNELSRTGANDSPKIDQFVQDLATGFLQWKQDPLIGHPVFTPDEGADEGLRQVQHKMLFALKLADRFAFADSAAIRTKITTYRKEGGTTVLTGGTAVRPGSLQSLVERITRDGRRGWATIGPDGKLIWNTEADKLRAILGGEENRYQHVWDSDRWVLAAQLAGGRRLLGWLEPNPENPQRPLAKFAIKSL